MNKITMWFEEVILQLGRLKKNGDRATARRSAIRISKLGTIDERAAEIVRIEKEHTKDDNSNNANR